MHNLKRRPVPHTFQLVDEVLDKAMRERRLMGAVLMVCVDGELQYQRAMGWSDREVKSPMRPDSIFRWASLTKPIIAATCLRLVEHGEISMDDEVTRFLPDFKPRLPDGSAPTLTLQHLITHTAGLTYGLFEADGTGPYHRAKVSDGLDQSALSIEENLRRIASVPLSRAPGTGWGYSVGTDVLGAYLARATRTPLAELVKAMVTDPLDMLDSGFEVSDLGRLVTPYADGAAEPRRMCEHELVPFRDGALSFEPGRIFDRRSYASAGMGMVGTACDFMTFLEAMRSGGGPVLTPQSLQLLGTIRSADFETMMPGWKWPCGWAVLEDPAKTGTPQSPGTWAWGGAYGSSWFVDPSNELSVILMSNTAVAGMLGEVPTAIRDAVYASL